MPCPEARAPPGRAAGREPSALRALPRERAAETLRRYGVPDEATRRALNELGRGRLATLGEAREAFDRAVATYKGWLSGRGR